MFGGKLVGGAGGGGGGGCRAPPHRYSIKNITKTTNLNERGKAMKQKLSSMYTY